MTERRTNEQTYVRTEKQKLYTPTYFVCRGYNKGMKLMWGNRNHENLENTFRTIRPVRPVNTQISLRISLRCSHELLWPLGFSRLSSKKMRFLIKASSGFFSRCLSQVFLYFSRVRYFVKSCDCNIWLPFHPEPQKGMTLSTIGQVEEAKVSTQKSLIQTKLILDCLTSKYM